MLPPMKRPLIISVYVAYTLLNILRLKFCWLGIGPFLENILKLVYNLLGKITIGDLENATSLCGQYWSMFEY